MAALVQEGVQLDRLYVYHMCTPSRSSYLSGRLPIHVEVALPNPENPNQGVVSPRSLPRAQPFAPLQPKPPPPRHAAPEHDHRGT